MFQYFGLIFRHESDRPGTLVGTEGVLLLQVYDAYSHPIGTGESMRTMGAGQKFDTRGINRKLTLEDFTEVGLSFYQSPPSVSCEKGLGMVIVS